MQKFPGADAGSKKRGENKHFLIRCCWLFFYILMLQNMHFATKLYALTENRFQFYEKIKINGVSRLSLKGVSKNDTVFF